jgi:hypothetical protein
VANKDELWKKAKKLCRLNMEDIALAKSLGMNPKSLIKNNPAKTELWKAPVKQWIYNLDYKRRQEAEEKKRRQEKAQRKEMAERAAMEQREAMETSENKDSNET